VSEPREQEGRDAAEHEEGEEHSVALELAHKQELLEMADEHGERGWQGEVAKLLQKLNAESKEVESWWDHRAVRIFAHPMVLAAIFAPILGYCSNRSLHAYQERESELRIVQDQRMRRYAEQQAVLASFSDSLPRGLNLLYQVVDNGLWCDFNPLTAHGTPKHLIEERTDSERALDIYRQRYQMFTDANATLLAGKNPTSLVAQVAALYESPEVTIETTKLQTMIRDLQNIRDPGPDGYDERHARLDRLHRDANEQCLRVLDAMGDELKKKTSSTTEGKP